VDEFVRRNTQAPIPPARCLKAQCYELEARAPYTAWGDALQTLSRPDWKPLLDELAEVWRRQLARLVPELGLPADDIEGTTVAESRLRLHQGVVQSLIFLTGSGPLLLWFDDLHWADETSLELLHYVSRHMASYPLLIIGTYRPEVAVDSPYLEHLLREAERVTGPSLVELTPLDRETIRQMLTHLGSQWTEELQDRLHQQSDGNPFLLVETLNALVESGVLRQESDGHLVEAEGEHWPVPRHVQDLIQARLSPLGEEERRVLGAGAVIGRPFGLRLLRRVSGLPESNVLDVLDRLLGWAYLDEQPNALPEESLDFHHEYFRRVIYEGLNTVQRRAAHRRVARALVQLHRGRPKVVTEEVAYHFEQAGDPEAIPYLTQAAQQAEELFAYHHATELYGRALTTQRAHLPDDLTGRFDLILGREAVLERQGRRTEQGDDVAELVGLAQALGDNSRLAEACVRRAGFFTYTGQHLEARQAGERALTLYQELSDTRGEAQALRELGFLHWSAGDHGTALSYGREALKLHRRLGDIDGEATALHNLAEIHRGLGSPRQALAQYEGSLNLYWARQDRRRQGLTLYGMAHAWRQLGDIDQALARYRGALDHCQAAGDRLMTSRVHHTLASLQWEVIALSDIYIRRGELDLARQRLREATTWLQLIEDEAGLSQAQARLHALERETLEETELSTTIGWVRSHVALTEGKVYCEFESPMAQVQS
jgi:tetratricopeptide (TPR) repeat protein